MIISALVILFLALCIALLLTIVALSCMPLPVLYVLSDITSVLLHHVIRYRRKVVYENLHNSFPEADRSQLRKLSRRYYRHLSDLIFEGIYNLRAQPKHIFKRYKVVNRELVNSYYEQGRSVVLMSAHYNDWEMMITTLNLQFRHHGVGVGKPLNNRRLHQIVTKRRSRFGTEIVDRNNVRDVMAYYHHYRIPVAYMMLSDQSPTNPHRAYWTQFLHQDTAFLYGAERFARRYDMPVLYYEVRKVSRARYEIRFEELASHPNELPEGDITERYARRLEQTIQQAPQYWLWSHRRWKLTREGRILKDGTLKLIPPPEPTATRPRQD